jgi:trans-aconitate 2-methyltransferase
VAWDPGRYERFRAERAQPFHDLLAMVERRPFLSIIDLGCGTGETTLLLHRALGAAATLGLDSSAEMLARAPVEPDLRFELGNIAQARGEFDLVFSNAALHWLPDHHALLGRLAALVRPGGQLAVQVPCNEAHASHQTALAVAREPVFAEALQGFERHSPVLAPSAYAALLHQLGFARQQVRLQVYAHLLESAEEVVEWVRGSLLIEYQQRLSPEDFARFVERYRERLLHRLGAGRPYLFTYDRLFFWAAK